MLDWTVKATDVAIAFAALVGPILAVWAADIRAARQRVSDRKENVFRTLWATRGARMQFEHVAALNRIELVFPQSSHPNVVDAWGQYLMHLGTEQGDTQDSYERWADKADDLFNEMMQNMATDLKISLSKTSTKYHAYYPKGYAFTEAEQNELRALLLKLLKNEGTVKINTTLVPGSTEEEQKMQAVWGNLISGKTTIPVKILDASEEKVTNS